MNRDEELTLRLTNLIESLAEETGVAEPPLEAAASWTEAAVRAYFRSGGTVTPAAACKDSGDVIPGQPGGGRVASSESNGAKDTVPQHIEIARMNASAESYRVAAFAAGIPDRPWGLFPPNDPVLRGIAEEPGSFKPLQKNIIGLSGGFEVVQKSWILSEGLDMRYFYQSAGPHGIGSRLAAAARFGDAAAIGAGFGTGAHGGSIETLFDECTAELVKCACAPTATTITFSAELKKAVPLNVSLRLDAWITDIAPGGLRIFTEATLKDPSGKNGGTLLATAKVTLCDVGLLQRQSLGLAKTKP